MVSTFCHLPVDIMYNDRYIKKWQKTTIWLESNTLVCIVHIWTLQARARVRFNKEITGPESSVIRFVCWSLNIDTGGAHKGWGWWRITYPWTGERENLTSRGELFLIIFRGHGQHEWVWVCRLSRERTAREFFRSRM